MLPAGTQRVQKRHRYSCLVNVFWTWYRVETNLRAQRGGEALPIDIYFMFVINMPSILHQGVDERRQPSSLYHPYCDIDYYVVHMFIYSKLLLLSQAHIVTPPPCIHFTI